MNKITEINMLNDAMFKALFRSIEAREMVASFLSSITNIPKEDLLKAEYQAGELPKKILKEKSKTSDIIVKIDNGNKIILEMNQYYSDKIFEKNTSYVFSLASETVKEGTKRYPKIILINFDNFNYFKTKEGIINFKLRDEYGHIETEQYHSIHLVLENIVNSKYNKNKEIEKVVSLLKTTNLKDMESKFEGDDKYMACVRKVSDLSTDPNFVGYYDIEEARRQDLEDMKETGLRQGAEKKQIEIAKKMLKRKMDIKSITEITGLSTEEIEKLI